VITSEAAHAQTAHQIKVRVGTPDDIDEMMTLAMAAVADNGFLSGEPDKLLQAIYPALCQDHGIVGVIEEEDGTIQSAVLLHITEHFYSNGLCLEEKSLFVHPDFRKAKGGRAARLTEFAKQASDVLGLPLLIGVLSTERTEAKIRLYTRTFGPPAGAFFLYNARTGQYSETEH
jgi:hypothetical protein